MDWLGLSLRISDRHAEGHMLAVTHWRHDKDEQCSDKPLAANSRDHPTKEANNRCDKRGTPRNPHCQHSNRTTAFRAILWWRSARWANALSYFISFTTLCANRHKPAIRLTGQRYATGWVGGKHAGLISIRGRWLHRLAKCFCCPGVRSFFRGGKRACHLAVSQAKLPGWRQK